MSQVRGNSFAEQAEQTYNYMKEQLMKQIDEQDEKWSRQDERRSALRIRLKQRMQSRLDLQQKSGQMITTTSQFIASLPVKDRSGLPAITRRAIREGEFLPHARHCCQSEQYHTMCKIPSSIVKEAIAMNHGTATDTQAETFKVRPKQIDYNRRRTDALNYFKNMAAVPEQQHQPLPAPRRAKQGPGEFKDIVRDDPMRAEYLAGLLTKQYKPDELNQLIEQEKRDKLGRRLVETKQFTISENSQFLMSYTGNLDEMDKTKSPNQMQKVEQFNKRGTNKILNASLPQMLRSAQLVEMIDVDGLNKVELAPETQRKAPKRKQVVFAADNQLLKSSVAHDNQSSEYGRADEQYNGEFDDEDSRDFGSDDVGGDDIRESPDGDGNECLDEIAWFEQKHDIR